MRSYVAGSYALYEILRGNPRYKQFTRGVALLTTHLTLKELHYGLLVAYGKKIADSSYDRLAPYLVDVSHDVMKRANIFRASVKLRKLSYADCLGYVVALSKGVPFLTGDEQFKGFENVEFVK